MVLWDPFRELAQMEQEMRRLFDDFWGQRERTQSRLPAPEKGRVPAERRQGLTAVPAVDLEDNKDTLVLSAEMPGLSKKDIKISVTEDAVSISGQVSEKKEQKDKGYYYCERTYSGWARTVPLPVRVESDKSTAKYDNGVLTITLPKSEEAKEKKREVKVE